jgi:FkbM family methyltransferase
MKTVNNFTVIESIYGKFIVNRHCHYQAEALIKTGKTHIEDELEKIYVIIDKLPRHSLIIDGGSNIGFFSIPISQRIREKGSKVIGFETQRFIFYAIAGAIALNDIDNCYVHNLGLSDTNGTAELPQIDYSKSFDFGIVPIRPINSMSPTLDLTNDKLVRTVRIDDLNLYRLDFIKLDVEGYECKALSGAMKTIEKFRPFIWVEYFNIGQETIKQTLAEVKNYDFHVMDRQNMLCAPHEKILEMGISINYA